MSDNKIIVNSLFMFMICSLSWCKNIDTTKAKQYHICGILNHSK